MLFRQIHQRARFARLLVAASFAVFRPIALAQNDSALTGLLSLLGARFAFEQNGNLLAVKGGIDTAQAPFIAFKEFPDSTAFLSTTGLDD